ncbi:MAG: N-acetyl-gamma-glutamyl-phosphate reductase [Halanaerobiaceae bacterium]
MIKASIVGATGYVATELLRLLNNHPEVELQYLISKSSAGQRLIDIYPQFSGSRFASYELKKYTDVDLTESDIVFTALPHGISQEIVADIYKQDIKVIDMSGDYRYLDVDVYESWYNIKHSYPEIAEKAVYGLVELNREKIKAAKLVANPGCYVTASILGLLPLIERNVIDVNSIIVDAKSGVSGAGKSLKHSLLYNEVHENLKAYNVAKHRHTSEIEFILNNVHKDTKNTSDMDDFSLIFTPHLIPIKRGILSTIYTNTSDINSDKQLYDIYNEYYKEERYIQVFEDKMPEIKYVVGSNYCHIGLKFDERTGKIIIVSVIDNMIKGSAGQAIQNMNLMFNIDETTGLESTAVFP